MKRVVTFKSENTMRIYTGKVIQSIGDLKNVKISFSKNMHSVKFSNLTEHQHHMLYRYALKESAINIS